MTPQKVIDTVLFVTGLKEDLVFSRYRGISYVKARQLIMFFAYKYIKGKTLDAIGDLVGLSHSTVIHSIKEIELLDEIKWQPYLEQKQEVDNILKHNEPIIFRETKNIEIKNSNVLCQN
jgi:chromosomal replication initiation ATPase DnaA